MSDGFFTPGLLYTVSSQYALLQDWKWFCQYFLIKTSASPCLRIKERINRRDSCVGILHARSSAAGGTSCSDITRRHKGIPYIKYSAGRKKKKSSLPKLRRLGLKPRGCASTAAEATVPQHQTFNHQGSMAVLQDTSVSVNCHLSHRSEFKRTKEKWSQLLTLLNLLRMDG